MNTKWTRWIISSLANHFSANKGDIINFHVQGSLRNFTSEIERVEFRTTGIDYIEYTKGEFNASLTSSLLITVPFSNNIYRIHDLTGRFSAASESLILVKQYGDDPDVIVGCLTLKGKIRTHDWGTIDPSIKVIQSSVESDFEINLTE